MVEARAEDTTAGGAATAACGAATAAGGAATTAGRPAVTEGRPEPAPGLKDLPGAGLASSEWPAKVAQGIEDTLGMVHDRVIRPVLLAARAVVFGMIIAAMALVLFVLVAIAVVRVLDVYAFGHRVWAADALVGALFVVAGVAAWSRRGPTRAKEG